VSAKGLCTVREQVAFDGGGNRVREGGRIHYNEMEKKNAGEWRGAE
jgi:hypothetical protein